MGRPRVRFILPSRSASYHMLSAAAAPAPSAMHRMAVKPSTGWIGVGAASSPHSPVNTTRLITRGLVSARKSRQSAGAAVESSAAAMESGGPIGGCALKRKTPPSAALGIEPKHSPAERGIVEILGEGDCNPLQAEALANFRHLGKVDHTFRTRLHHLNQRLAVLRDYHPFPTP